MMRFFGVKFGKDNYRVSALKACNDELRRMHNRLSEPNHFDMTKTEMMDRIVMLQDTLNEGVRRLCGLEY